LEEIDYIFMKGDAIEILHSHGHAAGRGDNSSGEIELKSSAMHIDDVGRSQV